MHTHKLFEIRFTTHLAANSKKKSTVTMMLVYKMACLNSVLML